MYYQLKEHNLQVEVLYRKRRSIEISLKSSNHLRVLAPKGMNQGEIMQFLKKKEAWIADGIQRWKEIESIQCSFQAGAVLPYLGSELKISLQSVSSSMQHRVSMVGDKLLVETSNADPQVVQGLIKAWYIHQANHFIPQRVKEYEKLFPMAPIGVKIRDQKSRWGSCTGKNLLNFNWRLMMTPIDVLDYVVVHELCHMKDKNHQRGFWEQVKGIIPDYQEKIRWLRSNGTHLFQHFPG